MIVQVVIDDTKVPEGKTHAEGTEWSSGISWLLSFSTILLHLYLWNTRSKALLVYIH
jgi:hypothetical protein